MNYKDCPDIEVGCSYTLNSGKSSLRAFCESPDRFVVKAGSVIDLTPWPNCLAPEYTEPDWGNADIDLALSGCAERLDSSMILTFVKDYDGGSPLRMAQLATGRDDKTLASLWLNADGVAQ